MKTLYDISETDHERLKAKIMDSGDFLIQEKLYLEKLIRMQTPTRVIRGSWQISKCPCCGAELGEWLGDGYHKDYEYLKICDCGQKLDWSYPEDNE